MNILADVAPDPPAVLGNSPWLVVMVIAILVAAVLIAFFGFIRPRLRHGHAPRSGPPNGPDPLDPNPGQA